MVKSWDVYASGHKPLKYTQVCISVSLLVTLLLLNSIQGFFGGDTAAKLDRELLPSQHPPGTMSKDLRILYSDSSLELSEYQGQLFSSNDNEREKLLMESSTLYVGNLSFHTTEE